MLNPKTGQYDGISTAYRIKAAPAYVVDPDKPMDIPILAAEEKRRNAYKAISANTIKATTTRIPQPVPPGTTEAGVGVLEKLLVDLPSKDYFLKTLDRPHYADGDRDWQGRPIDAKGDLIEEKKAPAPAKPAEPQKQVSNGQPTTVATAGN